MKPRAVIVLRLYVAGTSPRSLRAIQNARELGEEVLGGRYQLEVVDLFQQPGRARDDQILAVPTLVKHHPVPRRRVIGDLSDRRRVVDGLELRRA